jgi:hypothetical protein
MNNKKNSNIKTQSKRHFELKTQNTKEQKLVRIVEQMWYRSKKDINSWRYALQRAENILTPRRDALMELYDELILDLHLISLVRRTRRQVLSKKIHVWNSSTGMFDDEKTKLVSKKWFRELVKHRSDTLFYGHSLCQIVGFDNSEISKIELINRKHVVPEVGGYLPNQHDYTPIEYRNDPALSKYLFEAGDDKYLGMLNACVPMILFKKNAMIAWSEFCELFGLPVRYVTTNSRDQKDITRLDKAMQEMGKAAYGIFQDGEEIKFAETTRSDAYNVFDKLADRANSEMSKAILGETMTSDVGASGSRAQAQVHQDVSDEAGEENREETIIWLNEVAKPILNIHGYGLENFEFRYAKETNVSKDDFEIDMGLHDRFEIDTAYFEEKYGVKIKGVKNAKQQEQPAKQQKKMRGDNLVKLHLAINKLYNEPCCDNPEPHTHD